MERELSGICVTWPLTVIVAACNLRCALCDIRLNTCRIRCCFLRVFPLINDADEVTRSSATMVATLWLIMAIPCDLLGPRLARNARYPRYLLEGNNRRTDKRTQTRFFLDWKEQNHWPWWISALILYGMLAYWFSLLVAKSFFCSERHHGSWIYIYRRLHAI